MCGTPDLTPSLNDLVKDLDQHETDVSFGQDIDATHREIFSIGNDSESAKRSFLKWASRYQPCLFGRLGAKGQRGIAYDICWLTTDDIEQGDYHLLGKIQQDRRAWKDRASSGLSSDFLIMFCDLRLARAQPGEKLLVACHKLAELYIIEHALLERDTVYTESVPLKNDGKFGVFKAGINIFYPAAHRTLNHDRRVPGGILISVNSPGHLANSFVKRGMASSLTNAVEQIFQLAMHSIGNGGIGHKTTKSCSWHNIETDKKMLENRRPIAHRPPHIPDSYSDRVYSAVYHTDVLLPTDVTVNANIDQNVSEIEIWPWLVIDYISEEHVQPDHVNYALFHPHPVSAEARYHNPWPPRRARNSPLFEY